MRRLEGPGGAVLDPVVVGDQPLVDQVERVEAQVMLANVERSGGLSRWQPSQVGDDDLDDETAAGLKVPGGVAETLDLLVLTCWSWVSRQVMAL
jgi:hypothetical protein